MTTCWMGTQQPGLTRLLVYQDLDTDLVGVMGQVEEVGPQGLGLPSAIGPYPLGEPPATLG